MRLTGFVSVNGTRARIDWTINGDEITDGPGLSSTEIVIEGAYTPLVQEEEEIGSTMSRLAVFLNFIIFALVVPLIRFCSLRIAFPCCKKLARVWLSFKVPPREATVFIVLRRCAYTGQFFSTRVRRKSTV